MGQENIPLGKITFCPICPSADHSPPSSAEVNKTWSGTSTLSIRHHGLVLNKLRDTSSWRGAYLSTGAILPLLYSIRTWDRL
jgi:hypothetical protein